MKKLINVSLFLVLMGNTLAQNIGFSDSGGSFTPDASSVVEVKSTTKGFLICRMTQAQRTAISSPATGLQVFQTDGLAGFYFYDGSTWKYMHGWSLTGNSGTTAGTNYLGTSDAVDLVFKTAGTERSRINSDGSAITHTISGTQKWQFTSKNLAMLNCKNSVYIGEGSSNSMTSTPDGQNVFVGYQTGYQTNSASAMASSGNVFIGYQAGYGNTTGFNNTFVGYKTGYSSVSSYYNTFLGYAAGDENTGIENTFIGNDAGTRNVNGAQNTFIGNRSGANCVSGTDNTFVGQQSGFNCTGGSNTLIGSEAGNYLTSSNRNIMIGYLAGPTTATACDDKLYIDPSATNTPLIYGDFGTDILSVNGKLGVGVSPSVALDIMASSATVANFNRTVNDGDIITFQQAGITEGSISVSGSTISYTAFTGCHFGAIKDEPARGSLVSHIGTIQYLHGNDNGEPIYNLRLTTTANDPAVLGAYLGLQEKSVFSLDNPSLIMAVGNGDMWVADNGENLQVGDYLISSTVPGHAMKDKGEFSKSYIVARVVEAVNWDEVTTTINNVKHKKISVYFENFVVIHSENELNTIKQENIQIKAQLNALQEVVNKMLYQAEQ